MLFNRIKFIFIIIKRQLHNYLLDDYEIEETTSFLYSQISESFISSPHMVHSRNAVQKSYFDLIDVLF